MVEGLDRRLLLLLPLGRSRGLLFLRSLGWGLLSAGVARLACEVLGQGARPPFGAPGWNRGKAVGVAYRAPSLISSLWVSQKRWS